MNLIYYECARRLNVRGCILFHKALHRVFIYSSQSIVKTK